MSPFLRNYINKKESQGLGIMGMYEVGNKILRVLKYALVFQFLVEIIVIIT